MAALDTLSSTSLSSSSETIPKKLTLHSTIMDHDVEEIRANLEAIDKAKVAQKQVKIDAIDEDLKNLSSLEEKVTALSDAAAVLYDEGVGLADGGAFSYLIPEVVSGAEDVVSVAVIGKANKIEMDIEVRQLATKDSVSATAGPADKTTALGWTGDFDVGAGGNNQTIILTADMSLEEVAHDVNTVSNTTGVYATIITYASEARLTFQALNYAEPITVDTTNVAGGAPVTDQIPPTSAQTVDDLSAKVRYEGIAQDVLYTSNSLPTGDQYEGVALTLLKTDVGNPVTVGLKNDATKTIEAIGAFIDAFNEYQDFSASEEMYENTTLTAPLSNIGTLLAGQGSNLTGGEVQSLAEIGIQLGYSDKDGDGKLTFSEKKPKLMVDFQLLNDAITQKFDQVARVFGFSHSSTSSHFSLVSRADNVHYGDVDVTFTKAADNSLSATFSYDSVVYNAVLQPEVGSAIVLEAPEGSPIEGFKVLFNDLDALPDLTLSNRSATISMSQGAVDKVSRSLLPLLDSNPTTGAFALEKSSLMTSQEKQKCDLEVYEAKLTTKREREFDKLRQMEMAVAQIEQSKKMIETLFKAAIGSH